MGLLRHGLTTGVLVLTALIVSGCGMSFDVDPMTGAEPNPLPSPTESATSIPTAVEYDPNDPDTWSTRRLVAQTVFECAPVSNIGEEKRAVRQGLGGVVFLGGVTPPDLKQHIAGLVRASRGEVAPLIASDEEGGSVQRLAGAIYPLPSAKVMGGWGPAEIESTARKYAKAMKRLGVDMAFSPVADLAIGGHFIDSQSRAFSSNPDTVSSAAIAWATGLESAGVSPVIKHWPGHGRATDTHRAPGRIPPLTSLEKSDLIPFTDAIDAGFTAVMVGHLESRGLTEPGVPASRSPKALAVLRDEIGPDGLIITDSLSMEAALVGVGHRPGDAVYKSLLAGVDVALICSGPPTIVDRVANRVSDDRLSREMLIDKVTRILAWKKRYGVID
jgi:beta-N-acetylhexosaminidase